MYSRLREAVTKKGYFMESVVADYSPANITTDTKTTLLCNTSDTWNMVKVTIYPTMNI